MRRKGPKLLREEIGPYLKQIKSTPSLSPEQEQELARRISENGDPDAQEKMILFNLQMIVNIATKHSSPYLTAGDLIGEGVLALIRAMPNFDPKIGVRFGVYAATWVRKAIKRAIRNAKYPIIISDYIMKWVAKRRKAVDELTAALGRPPTSAEIIAQLGISQRIESVLNSLTAAYIPSLMDGNEIQGILEAIPCDESDQPEQRLAQTSVKAAVRAILEILNERERRILELRYGLDGNEGTQRTLKEISEILGLSGDQVARLAKKALTDLKTHVEKKL